MTQQPGFDRPTSPSASNDSATEYGGIGAQPLGAPPVEDGATAHGSRSEMPQGSAPTQDVPHYSISLGALVDDIKVDGVRMVKDNVALAKAEVAPMAKNGGIGAGMFAAAGYLGLCLLALLFMAGGFGFAQMWSSIVEGWGPLTSLALGFVTMAIVLGIIAAVLALLGKKKIDQVEAPKATIEEFKKSAAVLGESIKRGQQSVKANALDRGALRSDRKAVAEQDKQEQKFRLEQQHLS